MPFPLTALNTASKPFFTFAAFLLILSHGFISAIKAQTDTQKTLPFPCAGAVRENPTQEKPMRIGIRNNTQFPKFVKVDPDKTSDHFGTKYEGFCIDIFREVVKVFFDNNYTLHYEFMQFTGSYPDLVKQVSNGIYDAAVADITILANRSSHVEFSHPYMDSRLVMIAPAKSHKSAWNFIKPFTLDMWIATGAIIIYTMFIVFFMERRSNAEFNQPGNAIMFIFSTLFSSDREQIKSNFTRLVIVIWLFVVLILTSSYNASLTSLVTVSQLEPKVASIDWLKKTNSTIGCDGDSFVRTYLVTEIGFKEEQVMNVTGGENAYIDAFENNKIVAAFLQLPYGNDFMSRHGHNYTMTEPQYKRFAGLGFVFKKCSPMATKVSEAILTLIENEELKRLENKWFSASSKDSNSEIAIKHERLSIQSFWVLYLITGATSAILFLLHLLNKCRPKSEGQVDSSSNPTRPLQASPQREVQMY